MSWLVAKLVAVRVPTNWHLTTSVVTVETLDSTGLFRRLAVCSEMVPRFSAGDREGQRHVRFQVSPYRSLSLVGTVRPSVRLPNFDGQRGRSRRRTLKAACVLSARRCVDVVQPFSTIGA